MPRADVTDRADQRLQLQTEMLPRLSNDRLGDELAMTKWETEHNLAIPQDAAYLAAIREEITRRGLTEDDVHTAREARIAQQKANPPHTCCAACRQDAAS